NLCHRLGAYGTLYDLVAADVAVRDSVPYDWPVLAGIDRVLGRRRSVVGTFPLMSFTWATVAAADPPVAAKLLPVSALVQSSLWTMVGNKNVNRFLQVEPLAQGI